MGRDVVGIRISKKPAVVNFIPNGEVNVSLERVETKDTKAEEDDGTVVGECGEKQDVLSDTDMHDEKPVKAETLKSSDKKLSLPAKPVLESTAANDKSPIVSKPSDLETEDHANGTETVDAGSTNSNDLESPVTANKPLEQQVDYPRKYDDEEDNCSLASSSAGSARSTKFKVTVPLAPTFRSEERAARRKEFHMKLEEKHKALEAEKREQAARAREVEEAAIRQLRKSMVYKANPVPSFYREGPPPPKAGLKKLPVTRAKSPNLSRRKSCSDVFIEYPEEKKGCAKARHSIGSYTEGSSLSISPVAPKNKERVGGKSSGNGIVRVKGRAKSVKDTTESSPPPVEEAKESSPPPPPPVEERKESSPPPVEETKESSPLVEEIKESSSPVEEMKQSSSPVKEMQQNSAE